MNFREKEEENRRQFRCFVAGSVSKSKFNSTNSMQRPNPAFQRTASGGR